MVKCEVNFERQHASAMLCPAEKSKQLYGTCHSKQKRWGNGIVNVERQLSNYQDHRGGDEGAVAEPDAPERCMPQGQIVEHLCRTLQCHQGSLPSGLLLLSAPLPGTDCLLSKYHADPACRVAAHHNMLQLLGLGWHTFFVLSYDYCYYHYLLLSCLLSSSSSSSSYVVVNFVINIIIVAITTIVVVVAVIGDLVTVLLMTVFVGFKVVVNASEVDVGVNGQLK